MPAERPLLSPGHPLARLIAIDRETRRRRELAREPHRSSPEEDRLLRLLALETRRADTSFDKHHDLRIKVEEVQGIVWSEALGAFEELKRLEEHPSELRTKIGEDRYFERHTEARRRMFLAERLWGVLNPNEGLEGLYQRLNESWSIKLKVEAGLRKNSTDR